MKTFSRCFALLFVILPFHQTDAGELPNFVFIMADDLGWADVEFHGGNVPTPNLNRLAIEGLELSQHYVAPVCSPTRTGLMTGRCWSRFGITTPTNQVALPTDTLTLPRALKSRGYETFLAGKWHLGSLPEWGPNHFGFDHSYGSLAGGVSPWNHRYKMGPFTVTWHRDEQLVEEQGHVTDLLTDQVVNWIESLGESPFFLYVPYTAVHLPVKEPAKWVESVPETIVGDVPRHYAACIMHLDHAVGRVVEALEKKGLREKTLLVFTSDNGGSTAENNDLKYPDDNCPNGRLTGSNLPLRGQKADVYEGGTRVPTIVSWKGHAKPGKVDTAVQIIDWMPTFCSLSGYVPERDLKWDGTDLTKLLTDHSPLAERALYTVGPNWRARSLRYGDWKLIIQGTGNEQKVELYHLANDPHESTNLAGREEQRVSELQTLMKQMAASDRDSVAK